MGFRTYFVVVAMVALMVSPSCSRSRGLHDGDKSSGAVGIKARVEGIKARVDRILSRGRTTANPNMAEAMLLEAIERDPRSGVLHSRLAQVLYYRWEALNLKKKYRQPKKINPGGAIPFRRPWVAWVNIQSKRSVSDRGSQKSA